MANLKLAVIGAGSYVFGPSVLHDAILEHRLDDVELALVDVNRQVVELMARVGQRMANETGLTKTRVTAHTDRAAALDGASFVLCAAAREVTRRFQMDVQIAHKHMPDHLISEFGGISGISYSLRQIALIEELCADIRKHCPSAWLLNSANPLPRVMQAAHELGVKSAGFCSVSLVGYGQIMKILLNQDIHYPFADAIARYDAPMPGLNHFTWITQLQDRATGQDMLPELRQRVKDGVTSGNPRIEAIMKETGYLITCGDHHSQDFLPPSPHSQSLTLSVHGNAEERTQRLHLLHDIADGTASWQPLLAHPSWERPIDFVVGMTRGQPTRLHALNLVNDQAQIPQLPRHVFVETAATVTAAGPQPTRSDLPSTVLPYCNSVVELTDTIVRAARHRRRDLVHRAVEIDPTIVDKRKGIAALDECLTAHADILPVYS